MKTIFLFFCLCIMALCGHVKAQSISTDSLSLVDLYNSTNGSGWIRKTNWLNGPVATWYGVTVQAGRVTKLDLSSNLLQGTLPSSLGNLSELTLLYLYYNKLTGTVPSTVGNLSKLTSLWLFGNQLSGALPSSIGSLVNLDTLYLQGNTFINPVPPLGKLKKLVALDLSFNQFSGMVPTAFFNLPQLKIVNLAGNQFTQKGNVQVPGPVRQFRILLFANQFTFDGLESLVKKVDSADLSPQANLIIHQNGKNLSVYAGGTLANNTYTWNKVGTNQNKVITGDSVFTPASSGTYQVTVSNSILGSRLILKSNPFVYSSSGMISLSVSPNPATTFIQISGLNSEASVRLTVSDMNGHIWLTSTSRQATTARLPLETLQPGNYLLKADDGNEIKIAHFIKQ